MNIKISIEALAIARFASTAAEDADRTNLHRLHLEYRPQAKGPANVRAVATNGHRLAMLDSPVLENYEEGADSFVYTSLALNTEDVLNAIKQTPKRYQDAFWLEVTPDKMQLRNGLGASFPVRDANTPDRRFPDYEQIAKGVEAERDSDVIGFAPFSFDVRYLTDVATYVRAVGKEKPYVEFRTMAGADGTDPLLILAHLPTGATLRYILMPAGMGTGEHKKRERIERDETAA